jgi:hypothetical protein
MVSGNVQGGWRDDVTAVTANIEAITKAANAVLERSPTG